MKLPGQNILFNVVFYLLEKFKPSSLNIELLIQKGSLTPRQEELVRLRIEGLTIPEISEKVGIKPPSARTALQTGLNRMAGAPLIDEQLRKNLDEIVKINRRIRKKGILPLDTK